MNRRTRYWIHFLSLLVLCCQEVSCQTYSLERIPGRIQSENNILELSRLLEEVDEEEEEMYDQPESLGEWYINNVFITDQGLNSINDQVVTTMGSRNLFWENYHTRDNWKDNPIYNSTTTLTKFK